jgi:ABC-type sugar transport system ATPase subunit
MSALIEVTDLQKSFGSINAVQGFNLRIHPGEVVALVGDNGAGKSTIVKMLSGMIAPSSGAILAEGSRVEFKAPTDARRCGIETVHQDLALVTQQPVYSNLYLGRELRFKRVPLLNHRAMRSEARTLFDDLDVNIPNLNAPVGRLSGGQRQAIAIARAAHWARAMVIMDEPTAALGVAETARVEQLIQRLSSRGTAILIVSHNLDQVFRLASRIAVMRRGKYVGEVATAEVDSNDLVGMITGST